MAEQYDLLLKGAFIVVDTAGNQVQAGQRLAPVLTVRNGRGWRQVPAS